MLLQILEPANVPELLTVVKNAKGANLITPAIWPCVFLCLTTAGLVWFLQMAMEKGQLLRGYHTWIFKTFWYGGRGARIRKHGDNYNPYFAIPKEHLENYRWPVKRLYTSEYQRHWGHKYEDNPQNNPANYKYWPIVTEYRQSKWWQKLYKPLGGCPYCMAPYVGMLFYILIAPTFLPVIAAIIAWPLFIGLQYVFIELIKPYTRYA